MLSRRNFLVTGALAAGSTALPRALATESLSPVSAPRWKEVRKQFDLDPRYTHLALFYISSHPRPVREAIETHRKRLDANPLLAVEHGMFGPASENLALRAVEAAAAYVGGQPDDVALTQNTTTGLALLYMGLPLGPGDEVLTTTHDHMSHHESIRLAAEHKRFTARRIPLFDSYDDVTVEGIVDRVRRGIAANTRVLGLTWVHSSSGVKLPLKDIAAAVKEINAARAPERRVLIVVDGVHGLGVEEPNITDLGIDAFSSGTHKWILGPRGTGIVWAKPEVWASMTPTIPSFSSFEMYEAWMARTVPPRPARASWFSPGGFQAYEHYWALPAAFAYHQQLGWRNIQKRIHELSRRFKAAVAGMPHVTLYTPMSDRLSAGIVCFDVKGMRQVEVVSRLLNEHNIVASTTPYRDSYARVAFGIQNSEEEVDQTVEAIRSLRAPAS